MKVEDWYITIGSLTVDSRSVAHGKPVHEMTWHYVEEAWIMRSLPMACRSIGMARKMEEQLFALRQDMRENHDVVGKKNILVHDATSDKKATAALSVDVLTNYVGSVRRVIHSLSLFVRNVSKEGTL